MHFFYQRELLAFFASIAEAQFYSNEFFSAVRERTEINLNLADGNLLTYRGQLLAFVLFFPISLSSSCSLCRSFPFTRFCATTADAAIAP